MKLITEHTEDVQYLEEKVGDKKNLYIKGVFLQAEQKNRNGRVYPLPILEREVKRYNDKYIDQNNQHGPLQDIALYRIPPSQKDWVRA